MSYSLEFLLLTFKFLQFFIFIRLDLDSIIPHSNRPAPKCQAEAIKIRPFFAQIFGFLITSFVTFCNITSGTVS